MQIFAEQIVNALQMGALLFLVASGLSLIFGLMHVVNLAHGVFYMAGAYLALTLAERLGHFYWALVIVPVLTGVLGVLVERTLLSRTYGRGMYPQVLLTLGLVFACDELVRIIWGRRSRRSHRPRSSGQPGCPGRRGSAVPAAGRAGRRRRGGGAAAVRAQPAGRDGSRQRRRP